MIESKSQPLIERCLVCGAEFPEDADFCVQCETARHVLVDVVTARTQPHFLFGSLGRLEQAPGAGLASQGKKAESPTVPGVGGGHVRGHTPLAAAGKPAVPPTAGSSVPCPPVRRVESRKNPGTFSLGSILLDLLLCGTVNSLVFIAMCLVSGRSWRELVQSSLIPVSLVMICFSVLYFWLFLTLMQRTLGQILTSGGR